MSVIKVIVAIDYITAHAELISDFELGGYKDLTIIYQGSHHETKMRVFDKANPPVINAPHNNCDAGHENVKKMLYTIVAKFI